MANGFAYEEPLLFERSRPGRVGYSVPEPDVPAVDPASLLPAEALRDDIPGLPEVSEVDVVRHFTRLSTWNASVDLGLYPLGSCTMKYNPKLNERAARLPGFAAALAGAGTALAVGFTLFALGIIGAGDAKGLPVLGALFGTPALPGLLWWMAIVAGTLGVALIIARGEGLEFLRRWWLMARGFLATRTLAYLAPARESAAGSGLPFAIPMGLGTAAHQLWGTPWIG